MMLRQRGDFARAEPLLRAALAARGREAALGPAHPRAHALDHLAAVAGETAAGRRDEAAALYAANFREPRPHPALELRRPQACPPPAQIRSDPIRSDLIRRSLKMAEALLGPESPDARPAPAPAPARPSRAGSAENPILAVSLITSLGHRASPTGPLTSGSLDRFVVLSNAALLSFRRGDFDAAEAGLRRSLEMAEALLGPESPDARPAPPGPAPPRPVWAERAPQVATALSNLGQALARLPARRARPSRPPSLPPSAFHLLGRGGGGALERARGIRARRLGAAHPATRALDDALRAARAAGPGGGGEA
eukprot:tig00020553_g10569.t1